MSSSRSRAYPEHADNRAPHGGGEDAWRRYAERQPLFDAYAVRCTAIEPGRAVFVLGESPIRLNPNGAVHGGVVAALADGAVGTVFVRSVEPGLLPATASLTVDYHRPAFPPLTFEATLAAQGRTLAFCDVSITDSEGRIAGRARAVIAVKEMSVDPPDARV